MTRFILISFGAMGCAFYLLSGGGAFDPAVAREAAVMARTGGDPGQVSSDTMSSQTDPSGPQVTRLSLELVSFNDAMRPARDTRMRAATTPIMQDADNTPSPAAASAGPAPEPAVFTTTPEIASVTPAAADRAVIPSLIFPGRTSVASSAAVTEPRDLRVVSAAAVNMRRGPGTRFDVVTQLTRDTEVEIIADDGTGWVRLRPAAGGPDGWIADFLLSGR